jgi:hypothetical protein
LPYKVPVQVTSFTGKTGGLSEIAIVLAQTLLMTPHDTVTFVAGTCLTITFMIWMIFSPMGRRPF